MCWIAVGPFQPPISRWLPVPLAGSSAASKASAPDARADIVMTSAVAFLSEWIVSALMVVPLFLSRSSRAHHMN